MNENKIHAEIEIDVFDLKIDERYFSFKYNIKINGRLKKGFYESDHEWADDLSAWNRELRKGEAIRLAISDCLG